MNADPQGAQQYKSMLGAACISCYILAYPAILLLRTNLGERANRYASLYLSAGIIGMVVLVARLVFKANDNLAFEVGFDNATGIILLCLILTGAWITNIINIVSRDRKGVPLHSRSSGESWPLYAPVYQWMAKHKIRFDIVQILIEPALLFTLGLFLLFATAIALPYIGTFLLLTSIALHAHGIGIHALNRESILDEQDMHIEAEVRGMGQTKEPEIQSFIVYSAVPSNLKEDSLP